MKFKVDEAMLRVIVGRDDVLCAWSNPDGYLYAAEKHVALFKRNHEHDETGEFLTAMTDALGEVLRDQEQTLKGKTLAEIRCGDFTFVVAVPFIWDLGHYQVTVFCTEREDSLFTYHCDEVAMQDITARANKLRSMRFLAKLSRYNRLRRRWSF